MITVSEATEIIFTHLYPARVTTVMALGSAGKVLAEKVHADRDFPPFDRVAMDGIAISFQEWQKGGGAAKNASRPFQLR